MSVPIVDLPQTLQEDSHLMDIATIIGLLFAFGGIIGGYTLEGGTLTALISKTAIPIILGGTIGAVCINLPMSALKLLPRMLGMVFANKKASELDVISQIVRFSELARREGLLALETELGKIKYPLMQKGIRLIVDGTESHSTKDILSWDLYLSNDVYTRGG